MDLKRKTVLILIAVTLLVLWCSRGSLVYSQQPPPLFDFADSGEINLDPEKGSKVQLFNNTTKDVSINFSVIDKDADSPRLLSKVIEFAPTLTLHPAGVDTLTLRVKPNSSPGTYSAYLVAFVPSTDFVKRKEIKLVIPDSSAPASGAKEVKPPALASEWKTTAYYHPWSHEATLSQPLPLVSKFDTKTLTLEKSDVVAKLVGKHDGETVLVKFAPPEEGEYVDLPLSLASKECIQADEYIGETTAIRKDKSDGKTTDSVAVKLTIVAAHHFYYPVIIIILGIFLYYSMQRYLAVLRKVLSLKQQVMELKRDYSNADHAFKASAEGQDYANNSIKEDFESKCDESLVWIKKLKKDNKFSFNEQDLDYKNLLTLLADLRGIVILWKDFARTGLNALRDGLAAIDIAHAARPDAPDLTEKPAVMLKAEGFLLPNTAMKTDELKVLSKQIGEILPRISKWMDLNSHAGTSWEKLQAITKAQDFSSRDSLQQDEIKQAKSDAFSLWRHLWTRDEYDPAVESASLETFADVIAKCGVVVPFVSRVSLTLDGTARPAYLVFNERSDIDKAAGILSGKMEDTVSPERSIKTLELRMLEWDMFYLALVLAVAVVTGLRELYFDKPFGSVRDYLAVFIWGFATKAIIDTVTTAINRFWPATQR